MRSARNTNILVIIAFFFSVANSPVYAQQTLTNVNGWNAFVHLPASYSSNPSATYPTIIFFPGIGEIGFNPAAVLAYGPGAYLSQGWDGNVVINGNTVEFLIISLQPTAAFPSEYIMNIQIQALKNRYRIDPQRLYLTGLSHGGWCSSTFVTGDPLNGPYTYASQIAAVVTVQGMVPDDNQPYPKLFENFALSGGKYLGFEQVLDNRDTRRVVDKMNATVPNSGIFVPTTYGGGGHCCWSEYYGGSGYQPGVYNLGGLNQNIYQWLARQSLSPDNNIPPIVNAGPDITITLPNDKVNLNGSGSDPDGNIDSYLWKQISGPSAGNFNNADHANTQFKDLVQGQYVLSLTVTDNDGASISDTTIITVLPDPATTVCNSAAPVTYYLTQTQPGEIYRPDPSSWKGGDTIKITGSNYSVIEFYNVAGDPCRPIVIMPVNTLTTPAFRLKGNCRYIKVWGGPSAYGIKIHGSMAISVSHHIEVDNVECYGGSIGVYCKQDVVYDDPLTWHPNYRMSKFTFKNMWIHDIDGEGMYLGHTQPDGQVVRSTYSNLDTTIVPIRLDSVEVSNCLLERLNWDGIQLSNARDGNKIINNTVKDYGMLNISTQQAGIILGGNTNGNVTGNYVEKGTGNGIEIFGYGDIDISNNTLTNCGYDGNTNPNGTNGQQPVYASDFPITTDNNTKQRLNIFGNAINNPPTAGGIFVGGYYNNSFPADIHNNIFCIPNAPANWESIYIVSYVPGSKINNNTLNCGAAANVPPTANAGDDQTITLPTNTANLNGTATDADGSIVSYAWTKITGPSGGDLANSNTANAVAVNLALGVYQFELLVTDNGGAIAKDTMQVTVLPAGNVPPKANAGDDQTITLPTNTANLNGTATDADGSIVSYAWTKITGPSGGDLANSNTANAVAVNLALGVYQFELLVTDNGGAIAKDTIQVTVLPAGNIPPTANAGDDQTITLPTNTANLNGTATDADGSIVSYAWTKITGPSGGDLANSNTANAVAVNLALGVYQFELLVTDNGGAIAKDTIQVTVLPAGNVPPTANAGDDQTITLPTNTANLNGTATDADGSIVSYAWTKITGPSGGDLANSNTANAVAVNLIQGVYQFELTVADNSGATAKDTVQVNVVANVSNNPPVANAGSDQTVILPANAAILNGTATDMDGVIASYAWNKISGPVGGDLANAGTPNAVAVNLVLGTYHFEFLVTDNEGAIAKDTVQVTVAPAANIPPNANAGIDQVITLPVNTATLNGTATDADGSISAYQWLKISGPAGGDLANATSANTVITNLAQGVYHFEFLVTDNEGAIAKDTVQVTVAPAANIPPSANAGIDQVITLPVNTATLNGTATDADGSISAYQWLKISGPAGGDLANATSANTVIINLVQGVYQFEFSVTDNDGGIAKDTVQVTVAPPANIPPNANAGIDQVITLPVNTATLNGTATDADGSISAYQWLKISGPAGGDLANAATANTVVANLVQGVYQFEFLVTDNEGGIAKDTVQVTVAPAANIPPNANAGNDQVITLPVNTTTLNGTATDADGTVVSIHWGQISGPSQAEILNANSANATVNNLKQGIYLFEFSAIDNNGATSKDSIQVTVNAAANVPPIANAGNDITITLPTNSVTFAGSGTDVDGTIVSYSWVKISGLTIATLINANTATATANIPNAGVYMFQLTVTDNNGATGKDTVKVTVNPAPNIPPVANAGPDQVITLPTNGAYLSGTGTDADGTIVSYHWAKISGPAAGNILDANAANTAAINMIKGIYEYQFSVTDNRGGVGFDTVKITVNAAPNRPPIADAGGNVVVYLPEDSILLSGRGIDPDGFIAKYSWRMISAAGNYRIANPSAAQTKLDKLQQGVYTLEFTVTDNDGASSRDTINLSVGSRFNTNPRGYVDIYPNPVQGILHAYITSPIADEGLSIILTDSKGVVLNKKMINVIGNSKHETFDMTRLTPGIYFLEFNYGYRLKLVKKVIKM